MNWIRLKVPPRTAAVVLMVSVLARPGTPSIRRWPPATRQTRTRSSISSWPAMTRLTSTSASSRRARGSSGARSDWGGSGGSDAAGIVGSLSGADMCTPRVDVGHERPRAARPSPDGSPRPLPPCCGVVTSPRESSAQNASSIAPVDFRDTPEEARFRDEVRAWLDANLPDELRGHRGGEARFDGPEVRAWSRALYDAGWVGISWPEEYGGRRRSRPASRRSTSRRRRAPRRRRTSA